MMQGGATHDVLGLDISPVLKEEINHVDMAERRSEVQRSFLSILQLTYRCNVCIVFYEVLGDHDVPIHAC